MRGQSRDKSTNQEKATVLKRIICNHKKTKVSLPLKVSNIKKSEVSLLGKDSKTCGLNPNSIIKNTVSDLSVTQ
jgi:hypothetical protein